MLYSSDQTKIQRMQYKVHDIVVNDPSHKVYLYRIYVQVGLVTEKDETNKQKKTYI